VSLVLVVAGLGAGLASPVIAGTGEAAERCPKPAVFANVFSFGYAGDHMPAESARFETLLGKIQAAGFNTIHCTYTDERLALCRKHGIQMMVDLLAADSHVYKNPDAARALCEKLRGDPHVWGYNVWNDNIGKMSAGRSRDVANVRAWDPTHPAYCGTYRTHGMGRITNADIIGYYDFHWKRAPQYHFPHLLTYSRWAAERQAFFYRWVWATSGLPGKGNFNRSLYTVNTSIACGLKGVLWFLGTQMMDPKTLEWTAVGGDIARVNHEIAPLYKEIPRLGNPVAIYSTPITKTNKDRALPDGKARMTPPGLEGNAFPDDFWVRPASGEFVMGVFGSGKGQAALFVANHNCYAEQAVELRFRKPLDVAIFDRKEAVWRRMAVAEGALKFQLAPAGGELLRAKRPAG
jgi:hypothetical protein